MRHPINGQLSPQWGQNRSDIVATHDGYVALPEGNSDEGLSTASRLTGSENLRVADIPTPVPALHEVLDQDPRGFAQLPRSDVCPRRLHQSRRRRRWCRSAMAPAKSSRWALASLRFKPGDRVIHSYFPGWIDGAPDPVKTAVTCSELTSTACWRNRSVAHEDAVVRIPSYLSYAEAATLSCAGTTAWNALFVDGGLKPGATILLQGTGRCFDHRSAIGESNWTTRDHHFIKRREAGTRSRFGGRCNDQLSQAARGGRMKRSVSPSGRGVDLTVEVGGAGH